MADFSIEAVAGLSLSTWQDGTVDTPPFLKPSRTSAFNALPHTYWRSGVPSGLIEIQCRVPDVFVPLGPPDFLLGGRLFTWRWVDRPYLPVPPITTVPGFSSQVQFPAAAFSSEGHFTLQALRPGGGAVGFSFDVLGG